MQKQVDYAMNLDQKLNQKFKTYIDVVVDELIQNKIQFIFSSKTFVKQFVKSKKYLNVSKYQRENIKEFCEILEIEWFEKKTIFRIKNITISQFFKIWQIVSIFVMYQFFLNSNIRDIILANVVDLNKTWVITRLLLHVNNIFLFCE